MATDHIKKFLWYSLPGGCAIDLKKRTIDVHVWFQNVFPGSRDPVLAELDDKGIDLHQFWGQSFSSGSYHREIPGIGPVVLSKGLLNRGVEHEMPTLETTIPISDPETIQKQARVVFDYVVKEFWHDFEDNFEPWAKDAQIVQTARKAIGLEGFVNLANINLSQISPGDRKQYLDALSLALQTLPEIKGARVVELTPKEYYENSACGLCYGDGRLAIQTVDFHRGGLLDFAECIRILGHEAGHHQRRSYDPNPEAHDYRSALRDHDAGFKLREAENIAMLDNGYCHGYLVKARAQPEPTPRAPEPARTESKPAPRIETNNTIMIPKWGNF